MKCQTMKNQTTNKPSFLLYKSFHEPIKNLTLEEKGLLFDAIFNYQNGVIIENLPIQVGMAFAFFKNQFDLDNIKYKETCSKNSDNVRLRWEREKSIQANSTEYDRIRPNTNYTDKDKDKDKEIGKDKEKELKRIKEYKSFTIPTLQEIQNYCKERNNQIDPAKFFDYYNAGNWSDAKGNKIKNWKQKIITWENKTTGGGGASQSNAKNLCELINKMAGASYLTAITTVNNNAVLHFKSLEDRESLRGLKNIQEIKNKISSELGTGGIETEIRS